MNKINQNDEQQLIQDAKTIDWLVENTSTSVFDPTTFKGYQRSINQPHCDRIVRYLLNNDFFMPTSIICASDDEYSPEISLRVVDGQHRIEAFRQIKDKYPEEYEVLKDKQLSVVILEKADLKREIETFITINKTSKRVDTSLALVLRKQLNSEDPSSISDASKYEYLAVECAQKFNQESDSVWFNRISFEGTPGKSRSESISLNAFVRATRAILKTLHNHYLIDLGWESQDAIDKQVVIIEEVIDALWKSVFAKWPSLDATNESRRIVQGPLGYTAILKFLHTCVAKGLVNCESTTKLIDSFNEVIKHVDVQEHVWVPGGYFSQFTSGSGYNYIAKELFSSLDI